jgi:hypothetical protein
MKTAVLLPGGTSFGSVRSMPAASDAASLPAAIDVDAAGNAHVLWTGFQSGTPAGGYTVFLRAGRRPADDSAPMTTTVLETRAAAPGSTASMWATAMAAGPADTAIAAWSVQAGPTSSPQDTTTTVRAAPLTPGGGWATAVSLDSAPPSGSPGDITILDWPKAAMNASGAGAVMWARRRFSSSTSTSAINVRTVQAGAISATTQDAAAGAGTNPANGDVGIDDSGRIVVSWLAGFAGVQRMQVAERNPVSGAFGAAQTLIQGTPAAVYGGLDVSPDGHVLAAITTSGACEYWAATAPPGGGFGEMVLLGPAYQSSCMQPAPSLRRGGDGVVWMRGYRPSAYVNDAVGLDLSGPELRGVQIPSGAQAGSATDFSVQPVDVWGTVASTVWSFGDGATADGPVASHAFDAAGDRTVTVDATDSFGHASTASGSISVTPAPAPPQTGGSSATVDAIAPVLSGLTVTNRAFAVGRAPTALVAARRRAVRRGTTFRFALTEAGTVRLAIQRRVVRRCGKPRKRKRCVRFVGVGTLTRGGVAGTNRVPFSGRLGTKALRPGRYRAVIVAADTAGNRSAKAKAAFRVLRA